MQDYICAFRGRRDAYQVPLALAERGRLGRFITDAYATGAVRAAAALAPTGLRQKLLGRREPGIPDDKVTCLWGTTILEHALRVVGVRPAAIYELLDADFSRAAARQARRSQSSLFLYSSYAWQAFSKSYPHNPAKILFQYHPHLDVEERLLSEDSHRFPEIFSTSASRLENLVAARSPARRLGDASWQLADRIVCASSFTRRTLVEAGADATKIHVAPYGVDVPVTATGQVSGPFEALFVGSGVQRKGLHHLLLAWTRAALPADSRLTLVCRVIDPRLDELLRATNGVRLIKGVSASELEVLYASSTLFVMPSLVEGFGQVYLEALGHGLPVLGTTNTCLPDLGDERDGVFVTNVGDVDGLASMLEQLASTLPDRPELRERARACALKQTWAGFRASIGQVL